MTSTTAQQVETIAAEYRKLADKLSRYRKSNTKPHHLAVNVQSAQSQAGRLLFEAIKLDAFPESRADINGAWWSIEAKRWPGSTFSLCEGDPPMPETADRMALAWTFAVGSWLVKEFPHRFRENAGAWDWQHVATNKQGQPIGKDGQPIGPGRWTRDGELMPEGWEPSKADMRPGVSWKREGWAHVTDFYDEPDAWEHLRIRAEVYADACVVMGELLDEAARFADLPKLTPGATQAEAASSTPAEGSRLSGEARALAVLTQNPDWTMRQIADAASVNRTTLYNYEQFLTARRVMQDAGKAKYHKASASR